LRGGGWFDDASYCEVSFGSGGNPDDEGNGLGFRLSRAK